MLVSAYFEQLKNKRVAVLGIGVSNRPLIRMLLSYGVSVTACDKTPYENLDAEVLELEKLGAHLHVGESYLDFPDVDVIFRTPGMRPDLPQIARQVENGAVLTSEMEAFFAVCPCRIIAVTGSDGKTTTTTLIAEILKQAGHCVWVGGNIGQPLLPLASEMHEDDIAVVELSSFQLMTMRQSADIAVVTNLAPNHLDMHKGMEEYVASKENVYLHQDASGKLVVNMDNAITDSFTGKAHGSVQKFSRLARVPSGVYLENGTIFRDTKVLMHQADILLPGIHNVENYMAAACAVEGLASDDDIIAVARSFGGVEHRIELVRELDGVRYYNDSIASSPSRTVAGLRSFDKPIVLIAGGYDKQIAFDDLGKEICERVKILILCGATEEKIRTAVMQADNYQTGKPEILHADTLADAVMLAHANAEAGDVVTLSPACAAFDQFKNFMVRGQAYKELVMAL
ncbi:MAG: UDP-N-acetylmuramoyl-L-alanine--D-glutamate ligase [Oscillospiraceae bacterium]|nr:UDP-N-acetylmuramoyl-L-alanine--D-glutamate ligase [Oscillospiraceae bacterium]